MNITENQLKVIIGNNPDIGNWVDPLNEAMAQFEINNRDRVAAFLAQIAHESGGLRVLVENLNYSAKRLMQVWPKRFPTLQKAMQYENNPEKLANFVYANRMGNGNEASGDGWTFRGRGVIQMTGRGNYKAVGKALELDLEENPENLEEPKYATLSAAYFWQSHGLNELADNRVNDNDDEDFITISIKINGSKMGLKERIKLWTLAKSVI